jgi:hypothetical protein
MKGKKLTLQLLLNLKVTIILPESIYIISIICVITRSTTYDDYNEMNILTALFDF